MGFGTDQELLDYFGEDERLKASIEKDNTKTKEEALLEIYKRLDKETSGIVIFAKNQYVQECLIKQMKLNQFEKKYVVLVDGIIKFDNLTINEPISRKDGSIIERCVNPSRSRSYN